MNLHRAQPAILVLFLLLALLPPGPMALAEAGPTPSITLPQHSPKLLPEYWLPDGPVYALEADPTSGRLYLGGDFDYIGPYTGHFQALSLSRQPEVSATFPVVDGPVYAIAGNAIDGWYVGGDFRLAGGQVRHNLFRLTPGLALDPTWAPVVDGPVYALALDVLGGRLFTGGGFQSINGQARPYLAALTMQNQAGTTKGELVPGWQAAPDGEVRALELVQEKLYAGGAFQKMGQAARGGLACLDASSGQDTGWVTPLAGAENPLVYTLTSHSGGYPGVHTIIAGGRFSFTSTAGKSYNHLAAFASIGGQPTIEINTQPNGTVYVLKRVYRSGSYRLYMGGAFTRVDGLDVAGLSRLTFHPAKQQYELDGLYQPAPTTRAGQPAAVHALTDLGEDMLAGGDFDFIGGRHISKLARLNLNGETLANWDARFQVRRGTVRALAATGGEYLLAGGDFYSLGGQRRTNLAALEADGSGAPGFAVDVLGGPVLALEWLAGKLYLGGQFRQVATAAGTLERPHAAALLSNGIVDAWSPAPDGPVYALAGWQDDLHGPLLALGGDFTQLNVPGGQPLARQRLAVLNPATGQALPLNPTLDGPVYALQAQAGHLLAGGAFHGYAARFDPAGLEAPTSLLATGPVRALASDGGLIFLAGDGAAAFDGQLEARAIDSTTPLPGLPALRGQFRTLASGPGWVYLGGAHAPGTPHLSAFAPTSGQPSPWQPNLSPFPGQAGIVNSLVVGTNQRLFVGGDFLALAGRERPYLATLDITPMHATYLPMIRR